MVWCGGIFACFLVCRPEREATSRVHAMDSILTFARSAAAARVLRGFPCCLVGLLPAALVLDSWARLGTYGGRCLYKPTPAMSGR